MGESSGGALGVSDVREDVPKRVPVQKAKSVPQEKLNIQKYKNTIKERTSYKAFEVVFIADQNYAWSIDVGKSPDEIRATLRTAKGLNRVHRQFYHLSAAEMTRFILNIFPVEEHPALRKLIAEVVANCPVCKKHQSPAPKPSGQSKGHWAHQVNDLVCADTFA